ncbi:MAG TPA: hypothetical protein VGL71_09850, partial [Urbifossiella sp.]
RGWRPGGGGEPVRRGPKPEWIPTVQAPKKRTRRYMQAGLIALGCLLIGAGVLLWYLLQPPSPPVLLIVSTDPSTDAIDLHAPIDPYGWRSGEELEKWSKRFQEGAEPAEKKHAPQASREHLQNNDDIKTVEELASWAVNKARHSGRFEKPSELAIIYFGLHTGADAQGPFLFANKGGKFHVSELLKRIHEGMGETKVVVLFDPGRLPPDPAHGQLIDGFVEAMKSLNDSIAGFGNMSVILGCDSGERGWESEELQRTAFVHAVIKGLCGGAAHSNGNIVTARDLYEYVKKETEEWTRLNRPAPQHPVLLPIGNTGEDRAAGTDLILHHTTKDETAAPQNPVPDIEAQWKRYGELAAAKTPPDVYMPRHWRRYRELLLRYELFARSGAEGKVEIQRELEREASAMESLREDIIKFSATASAPMWQESGRVADPAAAAETSALGKQFLQSLSAAPEIPTGFAEKAAKARIEYSKELIAELADETNIKTGDFARRAQLLREVWRNQPVRPPDVQLILMLDRFYPGLVGDKETLPSERETPTAKFMLWQRAIQARRLAEEAALALKPNSTLHSYSEVIWRCIQPVVVDGDKSRRRAEDSLFAPPGNERNSAFADLKKAEDQYQRAVKTASELREALALRDKVMADLPFLSRWLACETDIRFKALDLWELWKKVHELARLIDDLPPESVESGVPAIQRLHEGLRNAVAAVSGDFERLRIEYLERLGDEVKKLDTKLQTPWLRRENLLAVPPLSGSPESVGLRGRFIKANRDTTAYLLSETAPSTQGSLDKTRLKTSKDRATTLGFLGLHELGEDLIARQKIENLTSADSIRESIVKIEEGGKWDEAGSAGDRLGKHYEALSKAAEIVPTDARAAEAERFSRVAISFNHNDRPEPAEVNRKYRWKRFLFALSLRTVHDHWYDTEQKPYFAPVSKAYEADAGAIAIHDPSNASENLAGTDLKTLLNLNDTQFLDYQALVNANPIDFDKEAESSYLLWTTEKSMNLRFALKVGAIPEDARAAAWAAFEPKAMSSIVAFEPNQDARRIYPLKKGSPSFTTSVMTDPASPRDETVKVRESVFLRGRYAYTDTVLALKRQPDLIYTQTRAPGESPRVAYVGPDNIDVGAVSIVLDYSPSMTRGKEGRTRKDRAMEALQEILKSLPDGTRLTIRGFGIKPLDKQRAEPEQYETALTRGGDGWIPTYDRRIAARTVDFKAREQSLEEFVTSLKKVEFEKDKANSPVVRTLLHAARQDFREARNDAGEIVLKDVEEHRTRVLIVITDGADNSTSKEPETPENFDPLIDALKREFDPDKGNSRGIALRLLLIKDDESKESEIKGINEFTAQAEGTLKSFDPPGSILIGEAAQLGKELQELLRPRVRMTHADQMATRSLREGIPISYNNRDPAEAPSWRRLPSTGEYDAWVGLKPRPNVRQSLSFESADNMLVRLRPGEQNRVEFERMLWGRYSDRFLNALKGRQSDKLDQSWLLSAVQYRGATAKDNLKDLDLLVSVEDTLSTRGQTLQQLDPGFVWWELSAGEEPAAKNPPKLAVEKSPLYIWREFGHPAPAWRFRRHGWTEEGKVWLPKSSLLAWVPRNQKFPRPREARTIAQITAMPGPWKDRDTDGKQWIATVERDMHTFHPQSEENPDRPDRPRSCVVVRVYMQDQKPAPLNGTPRDWPAPFFVQVDRSQIDEHHFYRKDGAYTGYFAVDPSDQNISVRVYSAADLADPGISADFELKLPGVSADGSDPAWEIWKLNKPN